MERSSEESRSPDGDETTESSDGSGQRDTRSVVFVSQQFPPDRSGHASRINDLGTNLAAEGWDVSVLAPPPSFPPEAFDRSWQPQETDQVAGMTVHRLWTWQPTSSDPGFLTRMAYYVLFAVHAAIWLLVAGRDADVVVTTTPPISTGLAGFVAAIAGQCWVVDVRDLWIDASVSLGFIADGGLLERVSRRYQRLVLRTADSIAVTTTTLGDTLCEQYGDDLAEKIQLVPNGVELSAFRSPVRADGSAAQTPAPGERDTATETPAPGERDTATESDDVDPAVVIYTGNIGHAQALDASVRALTHLPDSVVLRLVGGGDAVESLEAEATELGVRDRVEFVGSVPRDRVPGLLSESQVGIAPLRDDPELAYAMPTKVYEYLGCELPVVATGQGEVRRFIEDSGGGVHAEEDPESIAEAIGTLLADDELRARAGRRGHETVAREYDRDEIAAEFGDRLRQLLDREGE